jgi:ketosteroid isomerase-like protein
MPTHKPRNDAEDVALRFAAAMGNDNDTLLGLLADDFVRYSEQTQWQPMSRATYVRMTENFTVPFPDVKWEVLEVLSDGPRVVLHIVESGTFVNPWVVGDVKAEPNGKKYSIRSALFMTVEGGQIHDYTYIYDNGFALTHGDVMTEEFATAYLEFLGAPTGTPT